jgi:anthranilate synthase
MIMAIKHKTLPLYAVQFHPESIMSMEDNAGLMIIKNLLKEVLS